MSLYQPPTGPKPAPVTPCACCPTPALFDVWGIDLCPDCTSAWRSDERFDARHFPVDGTHAELCAAYVTATRAWATQRKGRRAA